MRLHLDRARTRLRHQREGDGARPVRALDAKCAFAEAIEALEDDIAVDEVEVVAADPFAQRVKDAAGAEDLRLEGGAAAVRGAPRLDLLVQVVAVDDDLLDAQRAQLGDDAREHRLAPDRQERLGHGARKRPQPRAEASRKDDGLPHLPVVEISHERVLYQKCRCPAHGGGLHPAFPFGNIGGCNNTKNMICYPSVRRRHRASIHR